MRSSKIYLKRLIFNTVFILVLTSITLLNCVPIESSETSKPNRIIPLSVGIVELLIGITPEITSRIVAIPESSKTPEYSNVSDIVKDIPSVNAQLEQLIVYDPDLVLIDQFTEIGLGERLNESGISTVTITHKPNIETLTNNITKLGKLLDLEDKSKKLVNNLENRFDKIRKLANESGTKSSVLSISQYIDIWTAYNESTEGIIITSAGGINSAGQFTETHGIISLEDIAAMNSEYIIITQPVDLGGGKLKEFMLNNPILSEVKAVSENRVFIVNSRWYTTLSHWNICGLEELHVLIHPENASKVEICNTSNDS